MGHGEKPSVPQHTCTQTAAPANGPTGAGLVALGQCGHGTQTQVSDGAWPFPARARELTHTNTGTQKSQGTDHSKGSLREAGHRASRLWLG